MNTKDCHPVSENHVGKAQGHELKEQFSIPASTIPRIEPTNPREKASRKERALLEDGAYAV